MTKLKLPAKMENLRSFVQFAAEFAQGCGFSEKKTREIELAVEETLVNICRYAYPGGSGQVKLRCKMSDNRKLIIEIEDEGVPFDVLSTPDPDLCSDIAHRKIGGLGIFLIRRMVNEVHYRREDQKNILTLIVYPEDKVYDAPGQPMDSTQRGRRA